MGGLIRKERREERVRKGEGGKGGDQGLAKPLPRENFFFSWLALVFLWQCECSCVVWERLSNSLLW